MKEIIDQIVEVDSLAFEKKTKNEQLLMSKKQEFENMIITYRDEKMSAAKNNAQSINDKTDAFIMDNEKKQKEEISKMSASIGKTYSKVESKLIQKIFNKLFVLEG